MDCDPKVYSALVTTTTPSTGTRAYAATTATASQTVAQAREEMLFLTKGAHFRSHLLFLGSFLVSHFVEFVQFSGIKFCELGHKYPQVPEETFTFSVIIK